MLKLKNLLNHRNGNGNPGGIHAIAEEAMTRQLDEALIQQQYRRIQSDYNPNEDGNPDENYMDFDNQSNSTQRRGGKAYDATQLFTENLPVIGRVPILFYIPKCKGAGKLKSLVHQYGGIAIPQIECCAFQISPDTKEDLKSQFGKGFVFSYKWIIESIASQRVLRPENYKIYQIEGKKEVSFSRTKFTIREIMKIFEVVSQNPQRRTKNPVYWNQSIERGYFPGRSVHSINAQWQRFCLYDSLDAAIKQAIRLKMPYCVSFREIPDHQDTVKEIIKQLKNKKNEAYQLEKMRQNFYINADGKNLRALDEQQRSQSEDDDEEDREEDNQEAPRLNQQMLNQQIHNNTDNTKKVQELLRVKDEPKSTISNKASTSNNLLGKRTRVPEMSFNPSEDTEIQLRKKYWVNNIVDNPVEQQPQKNVQVQQKIDTYTKKQIHEQAKLKESQNQNNSEENNDDEDDDNTSIFGLGIEKFALQNKKKYQQQKIETKESDSQEDQIIRSESHSQSKSSQDNQRYRDEITNQLLKEVKTEPGSSYLKNEISQNNQLIQQNLELLKQNKKKNTNLLSNGQRKSLSYRYSEIDFNKQLSHVQDQKTSSFQRRNPHNFLSEEEYNPQVYTLDYKEKLEQDCQLIRVVLQRYDEEGGFQYKRSVINKPFQVIQNAKECLKKNKQGVLENSLDEFIGDTNLVPQLNRLLHLHKKYGSKLNKTIDDLQKDLFSVNDDVRALEMMLRGEKVTIWTEIEDHMLRKYGDVSSTEFQLLIKIKGPEEVQKRRNFLGI
ncbi:UNKNOWN [Stylonychia lemnae]|uniref:BRCT domain-containing protein n=1 Tax=Stylonychia lemnae TaxID=5949 RepID=A0A078AYM8_STYLE|nr:UNKNOWN [Stylonychia lemnae]|eukprot:CDW87241.1 UNKNOWN [Stylonychia lemnae]